MANKLIIKHGLEANISSLTLQYGELASTNTGNLYVGNSSNKPVKVGSPGKKTCRFVVGTSTAGWTTDDCDYLCDGTSDNVEIQAAINALPASGGEIVILDGAYNLTSTVNISATNGNISLSGSGFSTQLIWAGSIPSSTITNILRISSPRATIKDLSIDGSSNGTSSGNLVGLSLTSCFYSLIQNCKVKNTKYGMYFTKYSTSDATNNCTVSNAIIDGNIYGINISSGTDNLITGSVITNSSTTGIDVNGERNSIVGNIIRNSSDSINTLFFQSSSKNNLITDNMIWGKNYYNSGTGNTFANNKYN